MRPKRLSVAVVAGVIAGVSVLGVAQAGGATDPVAAAKQRADAARQSAERAERDFQRLSAESNAVAKQLAANLTELDAVSDKIAAGERTLAVAEAEAQRLGALVRERAARLYVKGGASVGESQPADPDDLRRSRLIAVVNDRDDDAIERWSEARETVERERSALDRERREIEENRKRLRDRDGSIQGKLAEAERARAAARAAREQQVQALKDAETAALAARRVDDARRLASQRAGVNTRPGGNVGSGTVVNGIRCPIAGPVSFSNDWGEPRSGGRTHKGTDLFSPTGTPNVAVIGGSVFRQSESVGGLSVYLQGDNGNTYYYTHLSAFAGPATGRVNQGDIVGYTGNTGNASGGVTHTHFEIRLGGPNGERINPYPSVAAVC